MKRTTTTRAHARPVRAGVAPLEFVMALPFLVILAGILFTVARANLAKSDAVLQARNEAWHNRYGHGTGGELPLSGASDASTFARLTNRSAFDGLQSGSGTKSGRVQKLAGPGQYFFFGTITANANQQVLSGTWDYESIPFDRRPPLIPDGRIWVYTIRTGLLGGIADYANLFSELMKAVGAPEGVESIWNKVQHALSTVSQKLNELDREIREVEQRLKELRDKLIEATEQAVIREIEREIEKLLKTLEKLQESREKLKKGQDLKPR